MSKDNTKDKESSNLKRLAIGLGLAVAVVLAIILVFKEDPCFPEPEPEPVPCSGEHCPVSLDTTTGPVEAEVPVGDAVTSK